MDINNLLPEELEKIINELVGTLEVIKNKKNTNSKIVIKEKKHIKCPCCNSEHIIKNGLDKNGVQTYKCKECNKKFSATKNTYIEHSKLTYNQIIIFFNCMNDKLSIIKTAAKIGVNKNTAFLLRHKVLDCISNIRKKVKLKGYAETDEIYESINLKGTKPDKMPRYSKHRSTKRGSKIGVSKHQVCVASAIDEFDNCFFEIVGTGPITTEEVKKVLSDKIEQVSILVTDCKSSYEKFAHEKKIKLEQVKSGTYKNSNGYSLGNINSLHSEWATFSSGFKGISTKHLQHYLDWFSFQKIINYTVEILDQPLTMMKKSIINTCCINSSNVYENSSGIDFNEVYADYNSPLTI